MTDIWARFGDISGGDLSVISRPHDSAWYPRAHEIPGLIDACYDLVKLAIGERLGGVLITKLPPGAIIKPHIDSGWHAAEYEKIYLSVKSPVGSYFGFEDGEIRCEPGECYWFRNDVPHWVINDGDSDRISIIVCIKTQCFEGLK
jgi:hypothetical protein